MVDGALTRVNQRSAFLTRIAARIENQRGMDPRIDDGRSASPRSRFGVVRVAAVLLVILPPSPRGRTQQAQGGRFQDVPVRVRACQ